MANAVDADEQFTVVVTSMLAREHRLSHSSMQLERLAQQCVANSVNLAGKEIHSESSRGREYPDGDGAQKIYGGHCAF